jgi:hypothetical protein
LPGTSASQDRVCAPTTDSALAAWRQRRSCVEHFCSYLSLALSPDTSVPDTSVPLRLRLCSYNSRRSRRLEAKAIRVEQSCSNILALAIRRYAWVASVLLRLSTLSQTGGKGDTRRSLVLLSFWHSCHVMTPRHFCLELSSSARILLEILFLRVQSWILLTQSLYANSGWLYRSLRRLEQLRPSPIWKMRHSSAHDQILQAMFSRSEAHLASA